MKESGLLSGLFLYRYNYYHNMIHPFRLYINDAVVPIPEIKKDIDYGEHAERTTEYGYGYAFVSKGDILSIKTQDKYFGLSCGGSSFDLVFVPTRKK